MLRACASDVKELAKSERRKRLQSQITLSTASSNRVYNNVLILSTMKPLSAKLDLKRKLADLSNPTLAALHCPVCDELPRRAPIYNCSRGHLLCCACRPKVTSCPLCRCGNIDNRNQFAERLLARALDGLVLDCKNRADGCTVRDLADKVAEHEKICVYREVKCPARHRGACNWVGPLSKLLLHVIDQKCTQIVKSREDDRPFVSVIGDFNAEGMTVFGRNAFTHWKCVLLISRQVIRLFAYVVMYRCDQGNWIVYVRSFASDEALSKLQVSVTVRKPLNTIGKCDANVKIQIEPENPEEQKKKKEVEEELQFSFTGRIMNQKVTEQEVLDSGSYLCLKDTQVRRLCVDRTLFEYSVVITEKVE